MQDYDEKFPRSRNAGVALPANGTGFPATTPAWVPWHYVIQPYVKSYQLFKCPSNTATGAITNSNDLVPKSYYSNGGATGTGTDSDGVRFGGTRPIAESNGATLAEIDSSSQLLLVGENRDRADPDLYNNTSSLDFQNHLGTTNFLFADGHVKSMRPSQTVTPVNMWNVSNAAAPADNVLVNTLAAQTAKMTK